MRYYCESSTSILPNLELFLISEKDFANILGQTAVKQVLDGTISEKGILAPMYSKINDPLMKELKDTYG